jgi:hypothetical protein
VSHAVLRGAVLNRLGLAEMIVQTDEGLAIRVEARNLRVHVVEREVVAPFAVFGLVVDRRAVDLDLARAQVALQVGGVVVRVPQAELDKRIQLEAACFF